MQLVPDLDGRTALVTGSAQRVGRELLLTLAAAGADVAVHYNTSVDARVVVDGNVCASGSQRQQQLAANTLCAPCHECCSTVKIWYQLHGCGCARNGLNLRRSLDSVKSPLATPVAYRLPNAVSKVSCARS